MPSVSTGEPSVVCLSKVVGSPCLFRLEVFCQRVTCNAYAEWKASNQAEENPEMWRDGNNAWKMLGANATEMASSARSEVEAIQLEPEARQRVPGASGFARGPWIKSDKTQSRPEKGAASIAKRGGCRNHSRYSFNNPHIQGLRFLTPFSGRIALLRS